MMNDVGALIGCLILSTIMVYIVVKSALSYGVEKLC